MACTLDLLGDKWTLLVIRDLMLGRSRYADFLKSPERIATNILADRLRRLVAAGLVTAEPSAVRVGSVAYQLTERGESLRPVLEAMRAWGLSHLPDTRAHLAP